MKVTGWDGRGGAWLGVSGSTRHGLAGVVVGGGPAVHPVSAAVLVGDLT
ncbi:hypothetical protein ABTY96_08800 [Streptomyces sp. NPDC096057]